jgi:hypothetical protein
MTRTDSTFTVGRRPAAFALILLALACPALASGGEPPGTTPATSGKPGRSRSFEIAVGGEILTPQTLGSSTATLTSNNQTGTPYTYFVVDGRRAAAPAFRGRLGYNLTPIFTVEGGIVISRGNVQGDVSGDAEGATAAVLADRMTQYFLDVSVLAHLQHLAFSSGAGVPFLEAGGGYLRQVHEGNLAIDTGQIYHFGGGVTYMFSRRPTSKLTGLGFRADARIYVPRRGYSFGGSQQVFAGLGGSLLMTF